ncbi:hypothetical protein [Nonomuraea roseola]|uniref:Uncharacterized protein n=1 Tax=Nonomuraea roseola TaxID=46179 RepID=A0ABV5Q3K7_9ACTN
MGMFNTVKLPDPLTCPDCGVAGIWTAQFKFGATDLVEYEVGQRLNWHYRWAVEGERGHHRVIVQGILEGCAHCRTYDFDDLWEMVVIEIVDDVIVSVVQDTSGDGWWAEGWRVLEA